MSETFRRTKLEKFIQKKVEFMEVQQKVIETAKRQGFPEEAIHMLAVNNLALYNYTSELCGEFGIEMPIVLGVSK